MFKGIFWWKINIYSKFLRSDPEINSWGGLVRKIIITQKKPPSLCCSCLLQPRSHWIVTLYLHFFPNFKSKGYALYISVSTSHCCPTYSRQLSKWLLIVTLLHVSATFSIIDHGLLETYSLFAFLTLDSLFFFLLPNKSFSVVLADSSSFQ